MAKTWAMVFGWAFLVVGILGFIPNPIVGDGALFETDLNHNLVHLVSGAVLLYVAYKSEAKAAMTLIVFGIVYLLVMLLGFLGDGGSILGLLEINSADNWLHLVLGAGALLAGLSARKGSSMVQSI